MRGFSTKRLPCRIDAVAPDGSQVRILTQVDAGSAAHFTLAPLQVSVPVRHRTVSEIWYFLTGAGQMWRSSADEEEVVDVGPGTSITIPVGTSFQFRSTSEEPLVAFGVTMPPWPGRGEVEFVSGPWTPTVAPGPA